MAILTAISGLNAKTPAAFLLEVEGRRILLDLGEGPEPGVRPDLTGVGPLDAILLTHGHRDHVGAVDAWDALGRPEVHATAATFDAVATLGLHIPPPAMRLLPLRGAVRVAGVPLTLGRSGHAVGGVWVHHAGSGILYMGDWARESTVIPFDPPPRADVVVTDISYRDRMQGLGDQVADLIGLVRGGAVLPVPVMGRGTEMALRLTAAGVRVSLCPVLRAEMTALALGPPDQVTDAQAIAAALPRLGHATADCPHDAVLLVADTEREDGLAAALFRQPRRFIHTGHIAAGTKAARTMADGRGHAAAWNVHPRANDHLWLAHHTGAGVLIPAFGRLDDAPVLRDTLAGRWHTARTTSGPLPHAC